MDYYITDNDIQKVDSFLFRCGFRGINSHATNVPVYTVNDTPINIFLQIISQWLQDHRCIDDAIIICKAVLQKGFKKITFDDIQKLQCDQNRYGYVNPNKFYLMYQSNYIRKQWSINCNYNVIGTA